MFKRFGFALATVGLLMVPLVLWPVQVVTVTLPKQNNRRIAAQRIHPDDMIRFSYRHSVELIHVEGRFKVTSGNKLVAIETRMESVGTGLPNAHPGRTTLKNGWLVVDEEQKPVESLRFFVVPINQIQLIIADRPIELSVLKEGTLVQVSAEEMQQLRWVWWKVSNKFLKNEIRASDGKNNLK
jgi:hypothetical protein